MQSLPRCNVEKRMEVTQINLNHCANAQDLLWQNIAETKTNVVIIAEPYSVPPNNGNWVVDKANMAAIFVCGRYPIQDVVCNNMEGFVVVKINDVYVCSCYAPPRWKINEYEEMLDNLTRVLLNKSPIVIAGDFNAWATEWGSKQTKRRGQSTLEAFAHLDVLVANEGNVSTFSSNGKESVIDVTFCSPSLLTGMNWRVGQQYTASDHQYVHFTIGSTAPRQPSRDCGKNVQWKTQELNSELLCVTFEFLVKGRRNITPDTLTKIITSACDASMPRRIIPRHFKRPVYWWNDEIAAIRVECKKARRHGQRARTEIIRLARMEKYKSIRKKLSIAIKMSKKSKFKELCESVDDNPWGDGYRIVMAKLKGSTLPRETCPRRLETVVAKLFPQHEKSSWADEHNLLRVDSTEPETTNDELIEAVSRLKSKKAPGPDGIPNVVMKLLVKKYPDVFREVLSECMREAHFPEIWKRQKLVLIPKPGKSQSDPSSFRPIGLLDACGKLLEKIILNRLLPYAEGEKGLSPNQFGFRKKRSTLDAISMVTDRARKAIKNQTKIGRYCAATTIDVRNAFNSASWEAIVRSLVNMGVSTQMCKIIKSYLSNRVLLYDTADGQKIRKLTAGVPQGSILGPILWNIMYDEILRLDLPEEVEIVGFADDIVLLTTGDTEGDVESKTEYAVERIQRWLLENRLEMAHQKTEMVMVTNRRQNVTAHLELGDDLITSKRSIKYLGVMIDDRLNFTSHVDYVCEKATRVQATLARLLPNKFGARNDKRKLLANVVTSIIRYGAETWTNAIKSENNRDKLKRVHRLAVLRVVSAYRTISYDAACVIAGMFPICQILDEDTKCGLSKRRRGILERTTHREQSLLEWQNAWDKSTKGRWTHRLIPKIKPWLERRHGEVGYHLTQLLTGHGSFATYLCHKIKKKDSPNCPTCSNEQESPEHVLFTCPRFDEERYELTRKVPTINADNMVEMMCSNEEIWTIVNTTTVKIISRLDDERIMTTA